MKSPNKNNKKTNSNISDLMGIAFNQMGKAFTTDVNSPAQKKKGMVNAKVIQEHYRDAEGDTLGENIFEYIDPTSISSWDDLMRAQQNKNATVGERFLAGMDAIPMGGRVVKGLKATTKTAKAVKGMLRASNVASDVDDAANIKNSVKKNKFAFGGTAMNIDSPSEALAKAQRISQDASMGSMYDPLVMGLQGLGGIAISKGTSLLSQGVDEAGGLKGIFKNIKDSFALGGTAGASINAEGGEVVETPDGQMAELQGPSHEGGGMDMNVPQGTDIFSKRLKGEDGKTMAKRKIEREKNISKMQKLLDKDPNNPVLKKTMQRIMANNEKLDTKDIGQMNQMQELVNNVSKSFAFGGTVDEEIDPITGKPYPYPMGFKPPLFKERAGDIEEIVMQAGIKPFANKSAGVILPENSYSGDIQNGNPRVETTYPSNTPEAQASRQGLGLTLGDGIGMAANLFGPIAQMKNARDNRNATPTEVNQYKKFGEESLKKIQGQYAFIDQLRDSKLNDAELSRQGTINRNNGSARGINTQRALNLASDAQHNQAKNGIYDAFAAQTMGIIGQEATQLGQNDQMKMRGEESRADKELQNTDNYFNNKGRNISDMFAGFGQTGKALNQTKERQTTGEIMKGINPNYNFNTVTGKWEYTKTTGTTKVDAAEAANVKKEGTPIEVMKQQVATTEAGHSIVTIGKGSTFSSKFKPDANFAPSLEKAVVKLGLGSLDLDKKEDVRKLQTALKSKVTGVMGDITYNAIKNLIK